MGEGQNGTLPEGASSGGAGSGEGSGASGGVGALFRAGRLEEAVALAGDIVRRAPGDVANRLLLAEVLLFAGNAERADKVLDAAEAVDPSLGLYVSEFRHLLRAEAIRRQTWRDGRVPEFLGEPTEALQHTLKALAALRVGDEGAAAEAAAAAEAVRPRSAGHHNEAPFDDFRDADDLCAALVEVLTATGRYFWVPVERIAEMEFAPPRRTRDLFWRRCSMTVSGGPDGDVYVPALYVDPLSSDPAPQDGAQHDGLRIGDATDWIGDRLVRGRGQRVFLAGEDGLAIRDLSSLRFG